MQIVPSTNIQKYFLSIDTNFMLSRKDLTHPHQRGTCGLGVRCLPGMREMLGSNPLRGNILCSPSPSEETINRGPNTPIPTTYALIFEESKDPGIPPKGVP